MEMSRWLSEMGIEDPHLIHQYQMGNFGDTLSKNEQQLCSYECLSLYPEIDASSFELGATQTCFERPTKQVKSSGSRNSCTTEEVSSPEAFSLNMLSFGSSNSPTSLRQYYGSSEDVKPKVEQANKNFDSDTYGSTHMNQNYAPKASQGNKRALAPSTKPAYSQDHIIAERKRREKLSQRFIALSAVVPGLKKMDKASVLESSIRYVKELKERVKVLEEVTAKKPMESAVFVKKFQIPSDGDSSSTDMTFTNSYNEPLPQIETRVSDRSVLIRIHCETQNAVLDKALAEIKKLKLRVVSSSMIPFGTSTVDITVVAEMGEDFHMAVKDMVKKLGLSLRQFM